MKEEDKLKVVSGTFDRGPSIIVTMTLDLFEPEPLPTAFTVYRELILLVNF